MGNWLCCTKDRAEYKIESGNSTTQAPDWGYVLDAAVSSNGRPSSMASQQAQALPPVRPTVYDSEPYRETRIGSTNNNSGISGHSHSNHSGSNGCNGTLPPVPTVTLPLPPPPTPPQQVENLTKEVMAPLAQHQEPIAGPLYAVVVRKKNNTSGNSGHSHSNHSSSNGCNGTLPPLPTVTLPLPPPPTPPKQVDTLPKEVMAPSIEHQEPIAGPSSIYAVTVRVASSEIPYMTPPHRPQSRQSSSSEESQDGDVKYEVLDRTLVSYNKISVREPLAKVLADRAAMEHHYQEVEDERLSSFYEEIGGHNEPREDENIIEDPGYEVVRCEEAAGHNEPNEDENIIEDPGYEVVRCDPDTEPTYEEIGPRLGCTGDNNTGSGPGQWGALTRRHT